MSAMGRRQMSLRVIVPALIVADTIGWWVSFWVEGRLKKNMSREA